jgi:hypothetical protein
MSSVGRKINHASPLPNSVKITCLYFTSLVVSKVVQRYDRYNSECAPYDVGSHETKDKMRLRVIDHEFSLN